MSGAGSRARRVAATNAAKRDVYANGGAAMGANPYTDERCARIYAKAYAQQRDVYWRMESLHAEMTEAYGFMYTKQENVDTSASICIENGGLST